MWRLRLALVGLATAVPVGLGAAPAPAAKPVPGPPIIVFSGYEWTVKDSGTTKVGPGPNLFARSNVWLDADGRLHLRVTKIRGRWTCAQVLNTTPLGFGTYTWVVDSPVDRFDPNVVLGLFTYGSDPGYSHRELDVEFSRWGNAADSTNGQFGVQPSDTPGNRVRITVASGAVPTTHGFTWAPDHVDFFSDRATPASLHYAGANVPQPGDETARINVWLFRGAPPTDGRSVEVVVRSFTFTPLA